MRDSQSFWLASFQKGEEAGFAYVFREHFPTLSAYAMKFTHDQDTANDLVQTAFVNLWKQRANFRQINDITAYLYRTVHNVGLTENTRRHRVAEQLEQFTHYAAITEPVYQRIVKTEVYAQMHKAIEILPYGIAQVIKLYYLHEKKIGEIAAILSIPVYTVKSRRARGIKHLQKIMPGYFRLILILLTISVLRFFGFLLS